MPSHRVSEDEIRAIRSFEPGPQNASFRSVVASDEQVMDILKQVIQAMWVDEDSLLALPGCDASAVQRLNKSSITSLIQLLRMEPQRALGALQSVINDAGARDSAAKVNI